MISLSTESLNINNEYFIILYTLVCNLDLIINYIFVDSSISILAFIDHFFVFIYKISMIFLIQSQELKLIDKTSISSGFITHYIRLKLTIGIYKEKAIFFII